MRAPCEQPHPQSRHRSDQAPGIAIFCTLTLLCRRTRFAYAVCRSLPIASFRPCRCQQRPCDSDCLPPGRGGSCFLSRTGLPVCRANKKGDQRDPPDATSLLILFQQQHPSRFNVISRFQSVYIDSGADWLVNFIFPFPINTYPVLAFQVRPANEMVLALEDSGIESKYINMKVTMKYLITPSIL